MGDAGILQYKDGISPVFWVRQVQRSGVAYRTNATMAESVNAMLAQVDFRVPARISFRTDGRCLANLSVGREGSSSASRAQNRLTLESLCHSFSPWYLPAKRTGA